MLRLRNEVRRLKVAPRKAKPFAEINSGCKEGKSSSKAILLLYRAFFHTCIPVLLILSKSNKEETQ
ncbi:hypothetical protein FZC75_17945 [Sutcliffiella horikoshii]|uniref:Uncharacterized protein n=1 Tax=Sutcliffiella horikoshii TaxID=79883 RepID=A0A5D4T2Y7_9BACI|nr:hypothetical protein FZC75_17945 [Sutcliffiella horikoshii]